MCKIKINYKLKGHLRCRRVGKSEKITTEKLLETKKYSVLEQTCKINILHSTCTPYLHNIYKQILQIRCKYEGNVFKKYKLDPHSTLGIIWGLQMGSSEKYKVYRDKMGEKYCRARKKNLTFGR